MRSGTLTTQHGALVAVFDCPSNNSCLQVEAELHTAHATARRNTIRFVILSAAATHTVIHHMHPAYPPSQCWGGPMMGCELSLQGAAAAEIHSSHTQQEINDYSSKRLSFLLSHEVGTNQTPSAEPLLELWRVVFYWSCLNTRWRTPMTCSLWLSSKYFMPMKLTIWSHLLSESARCVSKHENCADELFCARRPGAA